MNNSSYYYRGTQCAAVVNNELLTLFQTYVTSYQSHALALRGQGPAPPQQQSK